MTRQHVHLFCLLQAIVSPINCFITATKIPADNFRFEIYRDDMSFVSIRIYHQLVWIAIYPHQLGDAGDETCFLKNLADTSFRYALTSLDSPTWQAPLSVISSSGKEKFFSEQVENYSRTTETKFSIFCNTVSKKNGRWRPSPILINFIVLQKYHFSNQSKPVESLLLCS